jgi:hypothetical protein
MDQAIGPIGPLDLFRLESTRFRPPLSAVKALCEDAAHNRITLHV